MVEGVPAVEAEPVVVVTEVVAEPGVDTVVAEVQVEAARRAVMPK